MYRLISNHKHTRICTASFLILTIISLALMTTWPIANAASYGTLTVTPKSSQRFGFAGGTLNYGFNLTVLDSQGGSAIPINNVNITVRFAFPLFETLLVNTQTSTPTASFTDYQNGTYFWDFSALGDLTDTPQAVVSFTANFSSDAIGGLDFYCTAMYHEGVPGGIDEIVFDHGGIHVYGFPPVTTVLNASGPILLGQSMTDTVTVAPIGSYGTPKGEAVFYWGTSTGGPWTQLGAAKTLNASGMATSDSFTPPDPGDYYFYAKYLSESPDYTTSKSDPAAEHLAVLVPFSISIKPTSYTLKPGNTASYAINVTNLGNTANSYNLAIQYTDFGMKYLVSPTVIQPAWTTIDETLIGPLNPGAYDIATLTISVPADWIGMENATYEFNATATMVGDTHVPPLNATAFANVTVQAAKASMTKYIGIELQSLMNKVGSSTLFQLFKDWLKFNVLMYAIKLDSMALNFVVNGNPAKANSALGACKDTMNGFISSVMNLKAFGLMPTATANNWIANAKTIVNDLNIAIATPP